jgi:hypothetical protein
MCATQPALNVPPSRRAMHREATQQGDSVRTLAPGFKPDHHTGGERVALNIVLRKLGKLGAFLLNPLRASTSQEQNFTFELIKLIIGDVEMLCTTKQTHPLAK